MYLAGVNGGILLDHITCLRHGLEFLSEFLKFSKNEDLLLRISYLVMNVKQTLYSLAYHGNDVSLVMNLEHAYANLKEDMKNVIMKPGTNAYDLIFPKSFNKISVFLCEKIKKLMISYCKANQITHMMKELEDVRKMLSLLKPLFECPVGTDWYYWPKNEEEKKFVSAIRALLGSAACFIYLSFVGKMEDELVRSLKNVMTDLIIEESQIMKMYLIIDTGFAESLKPHIDMAVRLLDWNKRCCLGTEIEAAPEDHFMSIENGLQFLDKILEFSKDENLKLRIHQLVVIVKQKLFSLQLNQEDENVTGNLEHAYDDLREKMQNVLIKPETSDHYTLFQEFFNGEHHLRSIFEIIRPSNSTEPIGFLEKIKKLVTSSCKAGHIAPMMKQLEEIKKKLTSLKPLIDYVIELLHSRKREHKTNFDAFITFLNRATCLIYLTFVGKMNVLE